MKVVRLNNSTKEEALSILERARDAIESGEIHSLIAIGLGVDTVRTWATSGNWVEMMGALHVAGLDLTKAQEKETRGK